MVQKESIVKYCSSTGLVRGHSTVGGLVGSCYQKCSIKRCFSKSRVIGIQQVGGLCGEVIEGGITYSYSQGEVSGESYIGGLVGLGLSSSYGSNYSTSEVRGNSLVAGFLGDCVNSHIRDCFCTGDVYCYDSLGAGFVSRIWYGSSASFCYTRSKVFGDKGIFGFTGWLGDGNINQIYWDSERSGIDSSFVGDPKTTEEMKSKETYTSTGWDFVRVWLINSNDNDGYPFIIYRVVSVREETPKKTKSIIYPNPATDKIFIQSEKTAIVRIFNMRGELMFSTQGREIDISKLTQGFYFVIISDGRKILSKEKLIVR